MLAPSPPPRFRIALLDVLRGCAILAMVVFHFCFDLEYLGLADLRMAEHWGWIAFARAIPACFITIAGFSLALAHRDGIRWRSFGWRMAYLAGAAMLVTLVSYFVDRDAIIWFGILHCIAVSSVLGLAFLRVPPAVTLLAALLVLVGSRFASAHFNAPPLLFLGLGTEEPPSDDYNPLFPWFAFMLIGIALARWLLPHAANAGWASWRPGNAAAHLLTLAGQHSLAIYLLHQPILFGLLFATSWLLTIAAAH